MTQELVVLVEEQNNPIGTAPKAEVHHRDTPLHRAFSCFIFNARGELLLQQRAATKVTWPQVWSNSCCGHPLPGEALEAAVRRRLADELGIVEVELALALPDYRYRAEHLGVVENEICPVWVGASEQPPRPAPEEVMDLRWTPWETFVEGIARSREPFYEELSPWCREETLLLAKSEALARFFTRSGR
jgi:isopentenyl-diphosphate Delta-isomerase